MTTPTPERPPSPTTITRRIVCVEDDDDTRFMLSYLLDSPGREIARGVWGRSGA